MHSVGADGDEIRSADGILRNANRRNVRKMFSHRKIDLGLFVHVPNSIA